MPEKVHENHDGNQIQPCDERPLGIHDLRRPNAEIQKIGGDTRMIRPESLGASDRKELRVEPDGAATQGGHQT